MSDDAALVKTVVTLFEFEDQANEAAEELVRQGFAREQISIVAGHELSRPEKYVEVDDRSESKLMGSLGKGLAVGGGIGAVAGGLSALLIPGVGPLIVGALASTFAGAGLGASAGGFMGALMSAGVDESDARLFESALRHGGVVLTLQTVEAEARRAVHILDGKGALDMDEHSQVPGDHGVDQVEGATDNRVDDTHRDHSR